MFYVSSRSYCDRFETLEEALRYAKAIESQGYEANIRHCPSPTTPKPSWQEFNRFHSFEDFFGCVDKAGFWFDSARCFDAAVSLCGMHYGEDGADMRWMSEEGRKYGCSIVHATLLRKLYEGGLIQ